METTAPLTAPMREAIRAYRARRARYFGRIFGPMALCFGVAGAWVGSSGRNSSATIALLFAAGAASIPLLLGLLIYGVEHWQTTRALHAGLYAFYTGPFAIELRGGRYPEPYLIMGTTRVSARGITPREMHDYLGVLGGGTVAYVERAGAVLAVWAEDGQVAFQLPGYDLQGDGEVAPPVIKSHRRRTAAVMRPVPDGD